MSISQLISDRTATLAAMTRTKDKRGRAFRKLADREEWIARELAKKETGEATRWLMGV